MREPSQLRQPVWSELHLWQSGPFEPDAVWLFLRHARCGGRQSGDWHWRPAKYSIRNEGRLLDDGSPLREIKSQKRSTPPMFRKTAPSLTFELRCQPRRLGQAEFSVQFCC